MNKKEEIVYLALQMNILENSITCRSDLVANNNLHLDVREVV